MDAVPSGSYLVMGHGASDIAPKAAAEMTRRYNAMSSAPITHLLVGIQGPADRAVADGMAADPPAAADGVLYHLLKVVRLPERVTAEGGVAAPDTL